MRWYVRAPLSLLLMSPLLMMPACQSEGVAYDDAGPADGGATDVTRFDAGLQLDGSPPPQNADGSIDASPVPGGEEFDRSSGLTDAAARAGCFDGIDNDGDGAADCDDQGCQQNVPSCCVGRSSVDCCDPGEVRALGIAACGVGELAACADATQVTTFGSPAPSVRADAAVNAMVPGGQGADSGALFSRVLDPRAGSLRLDATIASPLDAPGADLIEMVGVAFVDARVEAGSLSRVVPIAGVVVSRNRAEVLLTVAGEVAQRWTLETEAAVTYTLELHPSGRVRLSTVPEDVASADVPFAASSTVRAVVYGRTANAAAPAAPTRVLALDVTPSVCDMPAALSRTSDTVVPAPLGDPSWAEAYAAIHEPDVLRYFDPPGTEVVRMALSIDGEIHLAEPSLGGFVRSSRIGEPVLAPPTDPWAEDGVSDPALYFDGSTLHLYFTGWQSGQGTIGHALWDPGAERFVLEGALEGLRATGTTGYSAPALFDVEGVMHIALRVDQGGASRLSVFPTDGGSLTTVRAPNSADVFAYDRDEVDAPAVIFADGVYRMYFAGRRGTRWSIGLLISDDAVTWRPASDEAVLTASGSGFDALGVRDPTPDLVGEVDGVGGVVHLYHVGNDGERLRVGVARPR